MKDIKKIQEFFSKPLNEEKEPLDIIDLAKVVKAVQQTGHPVTVLLVPKFNEIEVITGMDAPDDMLRDLSIAVDSLGYGRNDIIIAGDSSNLSRREYSDIRRVNGGAKDYFEEAIDENDKASIIKDKIEKLRKLSNSGEIDGDEFLDKFNPLQKQLKSIDEDNSYARVSKPRFIKDKNNPNFLNVILDYDIGPGGNSIAFGKETMSGQIRRLSSEKARKIAHDIALDLEANFNLEDIEVTDLKNGKVRIFAVSDDFIDMDPNMLSEATKDEETTFHKKLDTLVHDTFGKRKGEIEEYNTGIYYKDEKTQDKTKEASKSALEKVKDMIQKVLKEEEGYSKFLKTDDNPEGKTKGLDTATMNKILMNVIKDLDEAKPGLWDNIRAKKERGEKPSHGNSKAHKDAVKAGKRINKEK